MARRKKHVDPAKFVPVPEWAHRRHKRAIELFKARGQTDWIGCVRQARLEDEGVVERDSR